MTLAETFFGYDRAAYDRAGLTRARLFALWIMVLVPLWSVGPAGAQTKEIVGWVEKVRLYPGELLLHAKLDTGADNSALNARNIKVIKKDGKKWVRFDVVSRNGRKKTLERRLLKRVRIKGEPPENSRRPVVSLGICLGGIYRKVRVNLVDRSDYNYQLLIGRSFLEGVMVVDPSLQFTREPDCTIEKAP